MPHPHIHDRDFPVFHHDHREYFRQFFLLSLRQNSLSDSVAESVRHLLSNRRYCGFRIIGSSSTIYILHHNPLLSLHVSYIPPLSIYPMGTSERVQVLHSPEDQTADSYSEPPVLRHLLQGYQ